jgi:hypothetical protein
VGVKEYSVALVTALLAVTPSFAANDRLESILRRLEPETRLEQICGIEAMQRIGHDQDIYQPERAVLGAISQPEINDNTISGLGGAFRSSGRWYQFSFTCRSSGDHMQVLSFDYKIGLIIPKEKWPSYGLWQ